MSNTTPSYKKTYVVYQIVKERGQYKPSKEAQLEYILHSYETRFKVEAKEYFVGPVVHNGQTFVKEDEVWIEMPDRKRNVVTAYTNADTSDTGDVSGDIVPVNTDGDGGSNDTPPVGNVENVPTERPAS